MPLDILSPERWKSLTYAVLEGGYYRAASAWKSTIHVSRRTFRCRDRIGNSRIGEDNFRQGSPSPAQLPEGARPNHNTSGQSTLQIKQQRKTGPISSHKISLLVGLLISRYWVGQSRPCSHFSCYSIIFSSHDVFVGGRKHHPAAEPQTQV